MPSDLLSSRLVAFRERHGLTQTDVAALLGVTPRYVSTLENGTKEVDPNTSLFRLFAAYESGQVPLRVNGSHTPHNAVHEDAANYHVTRRTSTDSIGTHGSGLSVQDALAQVRADLAMMEGGSQSDKRRAWHFLRDIHLPLLARCLKLE